MGTQNGLPWQMAAKTKTTQPQLFDLSHTQMHPEPGEELRRRISAAMYGRDFPLLTFIYPGCAYDFQLSKGLGPLRQQLHHLLVQQRQPGKGPGDDGHVLRQQGFRLKELRAADII